MVVFVFQLLQTQSVPKTMIINQTKCKTLLSTIHNYQNGNNETKDTPIRWVFTVTRLSSPALLVCVHLRVFVCNCFRLNTRETIDLCSRHLVEAARMDGVAGREQQSHLFYNQGQRPGLYECMKEDECVTGFWGGKSGHTQQ